MKKTVLFIVLSFLNLQAQEIKNKNWKTKNSINKDSISISVSLNLFIYGTLSKNISSTKDKNLVDTYNHSETPVIDYIYASVKKSDTDVILKTEKNTIYSKELLIKLDSIEAKIFTPELLTNGEKASIILGTYYRYGTKLNETIYKIQISNSNKHKEYQVLLMELGCKNIFYKRLDNYPQQHILYFEATDYLINYFKIIEEEKEILKKSYLKNSRTSIKSRIKHEENETFENEKIIEIMNLK